LYLQFFGLTEAPFSITPDPAFVYLSDEHRDALAHLLYGVGQGGAGGFVQLTGEVGTGKTTLCRCLLEQLPEDTHVALVLNPLMTPGELLATICEELGIDTTGKATSNKALVDALNGYLLEQHARGHRVVVVIDEAQNLSPEALEQVRLLTNLETPKEKLLQMVLLGQPELRRLLRRQDLRQLAQRITARYHLAPLDLEETRAYVRHRMMVAGAQRIPFSRSATRALYQRSGGVPRLINIIADRALAGAYARETSRVGAALVNAAASEVQPSEDRVHSNPWPTVIATASALLLLGISLVMWGPDVLRRFDVQDPADSRSLAGDSAAGQSVSEQIPELPGVRPVAAVPKPEAPVGGTSGDSVSEVEPLDELDTSWLEIQTSRSWRQMARQWRDEEDHDAIRSACNGIAGTGYACLRESGNWSRVRRLGLPVILVLSGPETQRLLLRGVAENHLLVGGDEDRKRISKQDIESIWLGEYIVVWPQAPGWPAEVRRGDSGDAVDIVLEMARFAEPPWNGGNDFDAGFEAWLMTFQSSHGLTADGIIGRNTLIYLMAPTIREPRLLLDAGEES